MGGSNGAFEPGTVQVAQPYFVSGRSGVLTGLGAGNALARLIQFGMIMPQFGAAVQPTPIRLSQIRLRFVPAAANATGVVLELFKGTLATPPVQPQHNAGGVIHLPQRRKTTGYPPITAAETSFYSANSTTAISGGDAFTPNDSTGPIEVVGVGAAAAETQAGNSVWTPADLCGQVIEAGEALELRVATFSGTGTLFIALDFLR